MCLCVCVEIWSYLLFMFHLFFTMKFQQWHCFVFLQDMIYVAMACMWKSTERMNSSVYYE